MKRLAFFAVLIASPAMAQHLPPAEQALGSKLIKEIQDGLQCSTNLISVQAELTKANERIRELEAAAKK